MIVLESCKKQGITMAVFDFDGTLSTLRCGWERVMEPLMLEMIWWDDLADERWQTFRDKKASDGARWVMGCRPFYPPYDG